MNSTVKHITDRLTAAYDYDEALALAYWIIEEEAALSRSELLMRQDPIEIEGLEHILQRLLRKEPIQYIFGHTEWLGLDLLVSPDTLIPRPETAELIGLLPWDTKPLRVLDIGTGSGCIAIAVKRARPNWQVTAIDISAAALAIAQENAHRCHVDIDFHCVDILNIPSSFEGGECPKGGRGSFDLVISNPPYIRESEKNTMNPNVLEHEPHTALFVKDEDPLLFYRTIAEKHLAPHLYFEINEALGRETAAMLKEQGYNDVEIHRDIYGKDRFITAAISV